MSHARTAHRSTLLHKPCLSSMSTLSGPTFVPHSVPLVRTFTPTLGLERVETKRVENRVGDSRVLQAALRRNRNTAGTEGRHGSDPPRMSRISELLTKKFLQQPLVRAPPSSADGEGSGLSQAPPHHFPAGRKATRKRLFTAKTKRGFQKAGCI